MIERNNCPLDGYQIHFLSMGHMPLYDHTKEMRERLEDLKLECEYAASYRLQMALLKEKQERASRREANIVLIVLSTIILGISLYLLLA